MESPAELARFQAELDAAGPDEPYQESLLRAVRAAFTWNPADEQWARDRGQLVLTEPAAQAQLFVVLSRWRRAAAEHVRQQLPGANAEAAAVVVGYAFVAGLLAAHERWVSEPGRDLDTLLGEVLAMALPALRKHCSRAEMGPALTSEPCGDRRCWPASNVALRRTCDCGASR